MLASDPPSVSIATGGKLAAEANQVGVMRPFPFPYRALLGISSDLDETPGLREYLEVSRFLNTEEETSIGRGVGLEVGNSIYFDMPRGEFSYWNTDERGRALLRLLMKSGHIDTLHSFGDLALDRGSAARALNELETHGCRVECWVDHALAPTNVGSDITCGHGDVTGSPSYHWDLTHSFGIRFVWRGRVTSVIGQDAPWRPATVLRGGRPLRSVLTAAKEIAKGQLGRLGNLKYAMHARNDVIRPAVLRDGHRILEFLRCNPHWDGPGSGATADGIAEALDRRGLEQLISRYGVCILYTHLGKSTGPAAGILPGAAARWFRHVAGLQRDGDLLVATTRRLLGYCLARRAVRVERVFSAGWETLKIDTKVLSDFLGRVDLSGLTFYAREPHRTRVLVDGYEQRGLQRNPPDETGRASIGFPWHRLEYPQF